MTQPDTRTWIADVEGVKAYVADVDLWRPTGWSPSDPPQPGDMVWLAHEQTGGRARFNQSVMQDWAGLGWHPSSPPPSVDLTKDPHLVDVPDAPAGDEPPPVDDPLTGGVNSAPTEPTPATQPADATLSPVSTRSTKAASGGSTKE